MVVAGYVCFLNQIKEKKRYKFTHDNSEGKDILFLLGDK